MLNRAKTSGSPGNGRKRGPSLYNITIPSSFTAPKLHHSGVRAQPARRSLWSVLQPVKKVGLASEARSTKRAPAKSGARGYSRTPIIR
jgi:hypothetical protein